MDKSLLNEKRYVLTDILPKKLQEETSINPKRYLQLNAKLPKSGAVVYWMNRDKRMNDNWALLFAQELALKYKKSLIVLFAFENDYTQRRYDFLVEGLKELKADLREKNIPFVITKQKDLLETIKKLETGILVTDFEPLNETKKIIIDINEKIDIPLYQVDAHNICPVFETSSKQEYAARTIRPKIKRILPEYLTSFPKIQKMPQSDFFENDWNKIEKELKIDKSVPSISWIKPGESAARSMLKHFIKNRLDIYDEKRNDPTIDAQSNLSAHMTFGHICSQTIALEILQSNASKQNKEAFLEELIIRKELSDNFCYYNNKYSDTGSFDSWAKETLKKHQEDFRPYIYSLEEFEHAKTHDELWNAAQIEMVKKGKMHGYMRMYWAKKILEWTPDAQTALEIATFLNDKYELDGCCPNGHVGIAWSIGGVHDRAWFERDIFGKIRYMSYGGCKGKFDIEKYINQISSL